MTVIEWLSGFKVILGLAIGVTLLVYMIRHRGELGSAAYCTAVGIFIMACGNTMINGWVWLALIQHHELSTIQQVHENFPLVGSSAWRWGSVIVIVGLIKIIREFSSAYVGEWLWVVAIALAATVPLFSIWY